jgi:DNA-binding MarR family transcriptional regulator
VDEWSPDTRRVLRAYLRAVAVAEPLQRELARTYGLALGDFYALRLLHDLGPMPIGRLGTALQLRPSSTTNLADRLEGAGLIERCAEPTDRRVTVLRLTERGAEALSDRRLVERSGLPTRIERLAPGERLQLATLLERLLQFGTTEDATVEPPSPSGLAPLDEPATQPIGAAPAAAGRGTVPNPMQPEQSETCR